MNPFVESQKPDLQGRKALIVDDDRLNLRILSRILKPEGLITEEIRQLISYGRSAQAINRAAARVGFRPLRYDGLKKVLHGLTTIKEIEANSSFAWVS
jgi:CheY-like chemotaxis protein